MNKRLACHYSVVRFCPYPETDEFANVGVVLACPALGYFDGMRADLRKRGRVGGFFPELDPAIYKATVNAFEDTLMAHRQIPADGQLLTDPDQRRHRDAFLAFVRPRESILYFSEPRVILSDSPATALEDLFSAYVERRFAHATEYQERVMCKRLETLLREQHLLQRYRLNEPVGDVHYRVRFPFVHVDVGTTHARRALKALHLDRDEPTDILRHADAWRNDVARLAGYGTAPDDLLFILQGPQGKAAEHTSAFDQVRRDLDDDGIAYTFADASPDIIAFAGR
ncbi:MAG: DUF3037 domain-containing protein [Opitutaceae bacterium]|jgi:hypothetical protein